MVVTKIPKTCKKTQEKYLKIRGKNILLCWHHHSPGFASRRRCCEFPTEGQGAVSQCPYRNPGCSHTPLSARPLALLCPGSRFGSENKEQLCPCSVTAMPRPPAPFPTSLPITSPTPHSFSFPGFPPLLASPTRPFQPCTSFPDIPARPCPSPAPSAPGPHNLPASNARPHASRGPPHPDALQHPDLLPLVQPEGHPPAAVAAGAAAHAARGRLCSPLPSPAAAAGSASALAAPANTAAPHWRRPRGGQ